MDGQRFDAITRTLGATTSRRSALISLVFGTWVARPGTARAQTMLGPGEACTETAQCDQSGGLLVCADNMIAEDGPLTCCRVEGGACGAHSHCCGTLDCVDGACYENGPGGTVPTPTDATATAGGVVPIGGICTTVAECAPVPGGRVICGDNLEASDGPLNCCLEPGSVCTVSAHCCGTEICESGVCGGGSPAVSTEGDLAPGDACSTAEQCSQSLGPAICGDNAASGGMSVCCLTEASPCTNDQECCGFAVCAANSISTDGGKNCCGNEGAACSRDAGCCGDLFCFDGVCGPLW